MDSETKISIAEAYQAMFSFIEAYWERGGKGDEIGAMLGNMQFGRLGATKTADPAQWNDWLDAVAKVTK